MQYINTFKYIYAQMAYNQKIKICCEKIFTKYTNVGFGVHVKEPPREDFFFR